MALAPCSIRIDEQGRELVQLGSEWFPIACYRDDLPESPIAWHWHSELEALIISEGAATVCAGTRQFVLRQGEGIFINSGVLHAAWEHDRMEACIHSVVFHPLLVGGPQDSVFWTKYLQPLMENKGLECAVFGAAELWRREAVQAVETAWGQCVGEPPGYEFWARGALSKLIFLLSKHRSAAQRPRSEKELREEDRVKRMLEYIHQHYSERIAASDIAGAAAVSESECLRCFRSMIGLTPSQYVMQYRIQKAAELLSASTLSVGEIGAKCGYQDASYFAKIFHAVKGYAPSEYRRRG